MRNALDGFEVEGIGHNLPFLSAVMDHPIFVEGNMTTAFIAEQYPDGFDGVELPDAELRRIAAATAAMHRVGEIRRTRVSGRMDNHERKVGTDWAVTLQGERFDVVVDAVGRPETYKQAFYARDLAGVVVLVGVPTPDMTLEMPLIDFFSRGGALKSSWYGDCLPERDFPMLVDLYEQKRLPLEKFVTERIGIGDVEAAFAKMEEGTVLRSVVEV